MFEGEMRVYSEQEIGAILKRTAELSKQVERSGSGDAGLSLDEIQALAADAGLDPNLVARAAAELSVPSGSDDKGKLFSPLAYTVDTELGVPVDAEAWESMLPLIRETFDDPGVVSSRSGVVEWTCSVANSTKAQVYVRRTPSGSRLHVYWSNTLAAIPFYIPTFLTFILSLPILFEELELGLAGIPIMLAATAAMFFVSTFAVSRLRARQVTKVDGLVQELTRIAHESNASEGASSVSAPQELDDAGRQEGRIALDFSDDDAQETRTDDEHRLRER